MTAAVEVLEPGASTTVQDLPGRLGYWPVGVPPSGPMDDLSHALVNRVVGNEPGAATLELTQTGPTLLFERAATVALGGAAMTARVGERPAPAWTPLEIPAGGVLRVGALGAPGLRAYLAVRGGFDAPRYLGSRSTFTLGGFGGHDGRALLAGDRLAVGGAPGAGGAPAPLAPGAAPVFGDAWRVGVLIGPHSAPEFLTTPGFERFLRTTWTVHHNSSRTGVRLVGPGPQWARADGGDAGLHPSNIHDTGYAFGAVDLTGDMPIVLGPDGPSLGGFVCPLVVASSERWKLGQLRPGDRVRFEPWTEEQATGAAAARAAWVDRAAAPVEPLARPCWNRPHRSSAPCETDDGVLVRLDAAGERPALCIRRAGDRFVLVELGEMTLDLELRLWVHAIEQLVADVLGADVVDATPGVRSLLVQLTGRATPSQAANALAAAAAGLPSAAASPVASRVVRLPLSWDDPSVRLAAERYMAGVRPDAPWCPWNLEFIRRINGLASVDDVRRVVFDASYLVLGLGDVYLGAPVATPLDPRHRLVTTKYNPARTWTPENAVGIGGAYLCVYGMEGPGGYQLVGRTTPVWRRGRGEGGAEAPWRLRCFDQLRFYPVSANELTELREAHAAGEAELEVEATVFDPCAYRAFLAEHAAETAAFETARRAAFAAERAAWVSAGESAARPDADRR